MSGRCYVITMDPDTGGGMGGSGICVATTKKVLAVGIATMTRHLSGVAAVKEQIKAIYTLVHCAHGRIFGGGGGQFDRGMVEIPRDYGEDRKADPNDLIRLSMISGAGATALSRTCDRFDLVTPMDWKGNRPKSADWRNTLRYYGWEHQWDRARANALPVFEWPEDVMMLSGPIPKKNVGEVLDAMGIAIHALTKEGAEGL